MPIITLSVPLLLGNGLHPGPLHCLQKHNSGHDDMEYLFQQNTQDSLTNRTKKPGKLVMTHLHFKVVQANLLCTTNSLYYAMLSSQHNIYLF